MHILVLEQLVLMATGLEGIQTIDETICVDGMMFCETDLAKPKKGGGQGGGRGGRGFYSTYLSRPFQKLSHEGYCHKPKEQQ